MTLISRLVFFKHKKTNNKSSSSIKLNEISIIIPVKDNQNGINNYLKLFFNTIDKNNYPLEIIIVDNNSINEISIPEKYIKTGLIRIIKCNRKGPASARNEGAKISKGQWLLFNDSDCLPTISLINGYINADNGSVAYAGNIKSLGKDLLSKYYETQEILIPLKTINENGEHVPQYLITANSLIWKDAFVEVNGFNESISIAGGEDVDLGLRLSQIGNLTYAFESVALHDFDDGLVGFYKRFKRYGYGNRIIEDIWGTNMKPFPFRPNKQSVNNYIFAFLQFLFLKIGYLKASRNIKNS